MLLRQRQCRNNNNNIQQRHHRRTASYRFCSCSENCYWYDNDKKRFRCVLDDAWMPTIATNTTTNTERVIPPVLQTGISLQGARDICSTRSNSVYSFLNRVDSAYSNRLQGALEKRNRRRFGCFCHDGSCTQVKDEQTKKRPWTKSRLVYQFFAHYRTRWWQK